MMQHLVSDRYIARIASPVYKHILREYRVRKMQFRNMFLVGVQDTHIGVTVIQKYHLASHSHCQQYQ